MILSLKERTPVDMPSVMGHKLFVANLQHLKYISWSIDSESGFVTSDLMLRSVLSSAEGIGFGE